MVLTQKQLETMQCDMPGCQEKHGTLHVHPKCHSFSSLEVKYTSGILTVTCAACGQAVIEVSIAKE